MSNQQETEGKRMISPLVVSGLYTLIFLGLLFSGGKIYWGDLYVIVFFIDGILFISATVSLVAKKNNLGTDLMIAGGILTFPVGIIAIIFAVIARNKLKKTLVAPLDGNLDTEEEETFVCSDCESDVSKDDNICPNCGSQLDETKED